MNEMGGYQQGGHPMHSGNNQPILSYGRYEPAYASLCYLVAQPRENVRQLYLM